MTSFEATLASEGPGTFIELPLDVRAVFGRARPPVRVTVNGHRWRSTVAVYGGRSYLPVNAANRAEAGVSAGDSVTVTLEADTDPREVEIPEELAAGLDAEARERWDALSYSHRREYADWIAEARRPQTRARRVAETLERLKRR